MVGQSKLHKACRYRQAKDIARSVCPARCACFGATIIDSSVAQSSSDSLLLAMSESYFLTIAFGAVRPFGWADLVIC